MGLMRIPDKYNTVYQLKFSDPELAQLDVRLRKSFGLMDSAGELVQVDLEAVKAGRARPEDLARLRALVDDFADALVSWSFTDDNDEPLPTDRRTVRALDQLLVLVLVDSFIGALQALAGQAAEELRHAADATGVDEASLPMQNLS